MDRTWLMLNLAETLKLLVIARVRADCVKVHEVSGELRIIQSQVDWTDKALISANRILDTISKNVHKFEFVINE